MRPLTVTEISNRIRDTLEGTFGIVDVVGEVTDYRGANAAGHHYFSLKDDKSRIAAVLFAGRAASIGLRLENGKKLRISGKLTAYAGTSRYQILVSTMIDIGVGDLAVKFEEMKRRLTAEGLFDKEHKKPLPQLPQHIGIVTSTTGAVIRDFINVITRRYPNVDILIAQARVQGEGAAEEIAQGVRDLAQVGQEGSKILPDYPKREVIVVMRGGGSMEELWCFNEEIVARAIYDCPIPVISGVGHETDFTIADFVADLRAPTPSAAAEVILPQKSDLERNITQLNGRLQTITSTTLLTQKSRLAAVAKNRVFAEPAHALESYIQRLDALTATMESSVTDKLHLYENRLTRAAGTLSVSGAKRIPEVRKKLDDSLTKIAHLLQIAVADKKSRIETAARTLQALSPLNVLNRGYTITLLPDGRALRKPEDAPSGTKLTTRLSGGNEVISYVDNQPPVAPPSAKKRTKKASSSIDESPTLF